MHKSVCTHTRMQPVKSSQLYVETDKSNINESLSVCVLSFMFPLAVKSVRFRPVFFADRLYNSMKGLGTDDETLVRVMVSRAEKDLVQIKMAFKDKYHKTLYSFIKVLFLSLTLQIVDCTFLCMHTRLWTRTHYIVTL